MEDTFNKLKQEGKNCVDNLIKWMQDSNLVDKSKVSEDKARQLFADVANKSNVEFQKFENAITKLAAEQKKPAEDLFKDLTNQGAMFLGAVMSTAKGLLSNIEKMEDTFNKLKQDGKNDVDNLIKWMQDSKLVDKTKASEDKARKLFDDVANKSNVEFKKFQEAITKLAAEQKKPAEDLIKDLSAQGTKFFSAAMTAAGAGAKAASAAFTDAMKK